MISRFVAVVGLTLAPQFVSAQSSSWQARFDAGWEAYQQGKYDEAAGLLGAAEREARTFPADDPRLAAVSDRLAWVDFARGKVASAESRATEALAWREAHREAGRGPLDVAQSLNTLACLLDAQGRLDEAEPLYKRALEIEEKVRGPVHPSIAALLDNLATLHHAQDHFPQAEAYYRRALAMREAIKNERDLAPTVYNLAVLYFDQRDYPAAEPLFQRSLALREKVLGRDHPEVAASLSGLATLYIKLDQAPKAEPLCRRALAILEAAHGGDHPEVARCLSKLAAIYSARGEFARAEPLCRRALAIREKDPAAADHALVETLEDYAALLRNLNRPDEAARHDARAREIRRQQVAPLPAERDA
jgi:tetratricopeptide (TPR) repeat protein